MGFLALPGVAMLLSSLGVSQACPQGKGIRAGG